MTQNITNISVDVLRIHPRNSEFFDEISGDEYERFKKSIEDDGLLSPLVVAPDMTIISGHQRLKACKEIGYKTIPVIIKDDLEDEDEKLKKLIAANFGRLKNDPVKQGKLLKEYERLSGVTYGGARQNNSVLKQADIAKELGVDVTTIQNLKRLLKMTPDFQEMVSTGIINATTGYKIIARLSEEEQTQLLSQLPVAKKLTQAQVQAEVDKIKAKQDLEVAALRASIKQKEGMLEDVQAQVERLESEPVSTDDDLIAERDEYKQAKRDEYEKRQVAEKEKREAEQRANKLEKEVSDLGRKLEKYVQLAEREPEIQIVEVEPKDYLKIKQELAASKEKIKNMEFINKHKDDLGVDGAHNAKYLLDTLAELNARLGACQYGDYINAPGNDQATINAALDQILEAQKLLQLISKKVEAEVA